VTERSFASLEAAGNSSSVHVLPPASCHSFQ